MFNDTYELIKETNKYKNIRENVIKMINVLSNSDVIDNLKMVQTGLKNYYLVNGSACKYKDVENQREKISDCLTLLKDVLNSIDSKLDNIKDDIEKAEAREDG